MIVFDNIIRQRTRGRSIGAGRDESAPTARGHGTGAGMSIESALSFMPEFDQSLFRYVI